MSSNANTAATEAAPRLDGKYWQERWEKDETNWRVVERKQLPFERNAKMLHKTVAELADDEAVAVTTPESFFKGCTVFVPLCGDTPALGFWANKMQCNVIGVDIAEPALKRALEEQFSGRSVAEATSGNFKIFTAPAANGEAAGSVTLYAGDAFELMANPQSFGLSAVDVVYDRASMVAIEPEMRHKYVAAMKTLLSVVDGAAEKAPVCTASAATTKAYFVGDDGAKRKHRVMFLNALERPAEEGDAHLKKGPPFNTSADDVFGAFAAAGNGDEEGGRPGEIRMVVPVGDDRHLIGTPDCPPFVDCFYSIITRTTA
jgi:hypothetical protein